MIRAKIGSSTGAKKDVNVEPNETIREALTKAGVNFSKGTVHVDGAAVDIDTTFADNLGPFAQECSVVVVVKGDAAV